ncbi:type II toxin-antitoxin system VapC family toxin [Microlunatus elymi]|uniref:Ribonuclease VapC n=1 Tax=Microlunatus elymi TaxID=2596828 RepID=A0A516PWB7_9ACTN|nr:type II toxin-antitoxin system VapC family toxin [Microlunatus elymi]QDP95251.1 type II toxin-antitoxin system VapC family toxin [Microlunatus elymi]
MIVDANILLYAVDTSSRFHSRARDWLEEAFNGVERVGLPWVSLTAFLRIATHPRASENPLSVEDAWQYVDDWLAAEMTWIPMPTEAHADVLRRLIIEGDLRGNLITDAQLAALCIQYGVQICSADSDFARFAEVDWINPFAV